MRRILLLLPLLCASCISNPSVSRTTGLNGAINYKASAGVNFMAEQEGVLASIITAEGDHIKFAVKKQDATKVPISFLRTAGAAIAGWFYSEAHAATEATAQLSNTNATNQAINASNNATKIASEGIAADVTKTITLPK